MHFNRIMFVTLFSLLFTAGGFAQNAKNVILMIADGAGYNAFNCTSYYQYGKTGQQAYDRFPVHYPCSTWCLRSDGSAIGYSSESFWQRDILKRDGKRGYAEYYTDSAAAGTAICTGVKTIQGRINMDIHGNRLTTIAEIADELGKAAGCVSTVPFSHATPASMGAHNLSRNHYHQIAREMIFESPLICIMGCGHPGYDDNGNLLSKEQWDYSYGPNPQDFESLKNFNTGRGWVFSDSKFDIMSIMQNPNTPISKLFFLPPVHSTNQYKRQGRETGGQMESVPDLAQMSLAALNILNRDEDGFVLMIEGGAVDWANHDNNLPRMIEEMEDFNRAAAGVVGWVEKYSSFDETLLIVTSDHECGRIWGPNASVDSDTPFDLPKNQGKGNLPKAKYLSITHSNALVPLYAIGPGADHFGRLTDGKDPVAAETWGIPAEFVDNTDIFTVMQSAISP